MNASLDQFLANLAGYLNSFGSFHSDHHAQLYSMALPELSGIQKYASSIPFDRTIFPNRHPAIAAIVNLSEYKATAFDIIGKTSDSNLQITVCQREVSVPDGDYFLVASSIEKPNETTDYSCAWQSIAYLRPMFALAFGKLPFFQKIHEFDFDNNGVVSTSTDSIELPRYSDLFKLTDTSLSKETLERVALQDPIIRSRASDLKPESRDSV